LADISLSAYEGWAWLIPEALVGEIGDNTHKASFTPEDTENYNKIDTVLIVKVEEDTSPIRLPQIASKNILAHTASNAIILQNLPQGAKVEVYNLQGKQVYLGNFENSKNSENSGQIQVAKGMYVVKISFGSEKQILHIAVRR
jgi:hypothetical protein